jgi:hypothetical protein
MDITNFLVALTAINLTVIAVIEFLQWWQNR